MPNLTTALPRRTGDLETDYNNLYGAFISLVDELKSILCNLDSGNVTEAASIKAQNIDASQAKIKDAQISSLKADKLTAGTIDAGLITVKGKNSNGSMTLTGESLVFTDKDDKVRVFIGNVDGEVIFKLQDADGTRGVYMNSGGDIFLTGSIDTGLDCRVQGQLRVGDASSSRAKGIQFYLQQFTEENKGYSGGIYPYVIGYDQQGAITSGIGIDRTLYVKENGKSTYKRVLTEDDLQVNT